MVWFCNLRFSRFFFRTRILEEEESTKVTDYAPWDNASTPKLPEPANRSSTLFPSISPRKMLKIDPFTLSDVGRICSFLPALMRRPLCSPEVMRNLSLSGSYSTAKWSAIFSRFLGPIPRTSTKSSSLWKGPWILRYSTIRWLSLEPNPGTDSSSFAVA